MIAGPEKQYDAISVSAFIFRQEKVLIAQRASDDTFLPEYWEQVGGRVEIGETQEEALVREAQEEAGIIVKPIRSYNAFEYTQRDGKLMCEYAYVCEVVGEPNIVLSEEHQNYRWISLEELHTVEPMSDEMRGVIQRGFANLSVR